LEAIPPWEVKREIVYKAVVETDAAYGCPPESRSLRERLEYGVVNFDKPAGPTSHDVTASVKRLLKAARAGHSGTLEGVFPRKSRCDRCPAYRHQRGH